MDQEFGPAAGGWDSILGGAERGDGGGELKLMFGGRGSRDRGDGEEDKVALVPSAGEAEAHRCACSGRVRGGKDGCHESGIRLWVAWRWD